MDLITRAVEKLKNYECEGQLDFMALIDQEVKKDCGNENKNEIEIDRQEKKRPEL